MGFIRRHYLVKKRLQFRIALIVLGAAVISSVVAGIAVYFAASITFGSKLALVYPAGRLVEAMRQIYAVLFVCIILISPIIFIVAILFSHKIAGPLIRIERTLDEIGSGNFDVQIKLRKHDELKDLAETINNMASSLKALQKKKS
ncbi:MAG: HAMP domain-containing protein [Candidatus Omnitrophota bacterium]